MITYVKSLLKFELVLLLSIQLLKIYLKCLSFIIFISGLKLIVDRSLSNQLI